MKKAAVITGGSGGIGSAVVSSLASAGYIPIINYFKNKELAEKKARDTGGIAICADVSDPKQVCSMMEIAAEKCGGIDVLVNNAGISVSGLFTDVAIDQERRIWEINVMGAMNCARFAIPYMVRQKYGKIINISSMWGEVGASCEVHYSASKAAIIGFTKALAKELGPSGINVNCVSPGFITTAMNDSYGKAVADEFAAETPLGRVGKPEDIAGTVEYLVSDRASFITGQIIGVNGGYVV